MSYTKQIREYWLRQAEKALKDGLPKTAKACLSNAGLYEKEQESFFEIWNRRVKEGRERLKNVENQKNTTSNDLH